MCEADDGGGSPRRSALLSSQSEQTGPLTGDDAAAVLQGLLLQLWGQRIDLRSKLQQGLSDNTKGQQLRQIRSRAAAREAAARVLQRHRRSRSYLGRWRIVLLNLERNCDLRKKLHCWSAARCIQRCWRLAAFRSQWNCLIADIRLRRAAVVARLRHQAAAGLQRWLRRVTIRRLWASLIAESRAYRELRKRLAMEWDRQNGAREKAAVLLQRTYRGSVGRRLAAVLAFEGREAYDARAHAVRLMRHEVKPLPGSLEEEESELMRHRIQAATKLQWFARTVAARRSWSKLLDETAAYASLVARRNLMLKRLAARSAGATATPALSVAMSAAQSAAVDKLQRWRMVSMSTARMRINFAIRLQRAARAALMRKKWRVLLDAATTYSVMVRRRDAVEQTWRRRACSKDVIVGPSAQPSATAAEMTAARLLQRWWRRVVTRRAWRPLILDLREHHEKVSHLKRNNAAERLQLWLRRAMIRRLWREMIARKRAYRERYAAALKEVELLYFRAAVVVQSRFRGRTGRCLAAVLASKGRQAYEIELREVESKRDGRREDRRRKNEASAALTIQTHLRGWKLRCNFCKLLASTRTLQRRVKHKRATRKWKQLLDEATAYGHMKRRREAILLRLGNSTIEPLPDPGRPLRKRWSGGLSEAKMRIDSAVRLQRALKRLLTRQRWCKLVDEVKVYKQMLSRREEILTKLSAHKKPALVQSALPFQGQVEFACDCLPTGESGSQPVEVIETDDYVTSTRRKAPVLIPAEVAVVLLQRWWRRAIIRLAWKSLLEYVRTHKSQVQALKRNYAAERLQRWLRRVMLRRLWCDMIQRARARREMRSQLMQELTLMRNEAVTAVQAHFRGMVARRQKTALMAGPAAYTAYMAQRELAAQEYLSRKLQERRMRDAVVFLQLRFRYLQHWKLVQPAARIQSAARRFLKHLEENRRPSHATKVPGKILILNPVAPRKKKKLRFKSVSLVESRRSSIQSLPPVPENFAAMSPSLGGLREAYGAAHELATRLLQRWWRRKLVRRAWGSLLEYAYVRKDKIIAYTRNQAAERLQQWLRRVMIRRLWRGMITRARAYKELMLLLQEHRQEATRERAACLLQACIRGRAGRARSLALGTRALRAASATLRTEDWAAQLPVIIRLQRWVRKLKVRRRWAKLLEESHAHAVMVARRNSILAKLSAKNGGSHVVHASVSPRHAGNSLQTAIAYRVGVLKIQRWWRCQRCYFQWRAVLFSLQCIQSYGKCEVEVTAAAFKIQRRFRATKTRQLWRTLVDDLSCHKMLLERRENVLRALGSQREA